jgi:hypothetical protein
MTTGRVSGVARSHSRAARQDLTLARTAGRHLVVHPGVRPLEPVLQSDLWFPAKTFLDEGVVAVSTSDTLRSVQVVRTAKL